MNANDVWVDVNDENLSNLEFEAFGVQFRAQFNDRVLGGGAVEVSLNLYGLNPDEEREDELDVIIREHTPISDNDEAYYSTSILITRDMADDVREWFEAIDQEIAELDAQANEAYDA